MPKKSDSTEPAVMSAAFSSFALFLCSFRALGCTSMTLITLDGLKNKRLLEIWTYESPRDTMGYLTIGYQVNIKDRVYKVLVVKL